MNIQIDAKGKQCPLPVIEAKNAISGMTEAGIVEVTVDNEIAVQNLTKMADHKGLKAKSEKKSDQEYTVWMEVTEEFVKNNIKDGNVSSTPVTGENCIPDIRKKKTVVVLGADHMGEGDDKLGKMLMKGFVYALTQLEELPQTQGVEVMTCGTCLNHYGLTEKLAVGSVTNMYVIAQTMMEADHIVKP